VHQVAGSFGLGGQESSQNPGAREPDRLLLAGWVVSRFWAGFGQSIRQSFGQSNREDKPNIGKIASDIGIYIHEFVGLCGCYVIY
jgi:hypothetical protein